MAVSGDEIRDAARFARESVAVGRAIMLARWIGTGRRPLTPGQVLRKADVPAAGAALGVDVPPRLRTMTDIRALHRPWCTAVATGLLQVGDGWVIAGPALEGWPPGDADLLAGWLAGLRAVCAAESYPQDEDSVRLLALALLMVLGEDSVPVTDGLWPEVTAALDDLCDRYDKPSWEVLGAAGRYYDLETGAPLAGLAELLAEFGAVTGDPGKTAITSLGRWAAGHLAEGLPGLADPGWPAGKMIAAAARFGDEEQRGHVAWGCCSAGTATTCTCSGWGRSSTATRSCTWTGRRTKTRPGSGMPWRRAGRSRTPMTSGPAGSTRSRWRIRSPVTLARTIRSAWHSGATPRSSTGPRTTRPNRSRSAWPRSTASWLRSAARRSEGISLLPR